MSGRLESLDVLRGFDMFFIFLPDPVPCIVFTFCAMMGWERSACGTCWRHAHRGDSVPIGQGLA